MSANQLDDRVEAPEEIDVEELRRVQVPPGLSIEIQDFHL